MAIFVAAVVASILPGIAMVLGRLGGHDAWWKGRAVPVACVWGIAAGWGLGAAWLGRVPRFPPTEDLDRLSLIVVPVVVMIETLKAGRVWVKWCWILRALVGLGLAPVVLWGSSYLKFSAMANGEIITVARMLGGLAIIGVLTVAITFVWSWSESRNPSRRWPVLLSLSCLAGGVTTMASGYLGAGLLMFPLAAAIVGPLLLAFRSEAIAHRETYAGYPIFVGLLLVGYFFADLSLFHGIVLAGAPLIGVLPEYVRPKNVTWRSWQSSLAVAALAALPLGLVMWQANRQHKLQSAGHKHVPPHGSPSIQDYLQYRSPQSTQ